MTHARDYEFFEHTADMGIRAQASTLSEVFVALAHGLMALLVEDSVVTTGAQHRTMSLERHDAESLLLAWLQELLFWFSTERFVAAEYRMEQLTPTALRATISGERFDPTRHAQGREVKAITRHRLEVRQEDGRWYGQVIVDI